ncbi:MAG: hypothetical protein KBA31_06315 [Alphaproteobacteria bacterium]|nr:hypothetical protein [Alphaproteobacteria bacterium]
MASGFLNLLRVREKDNLEFWVSHAIILASTVLGVYLAASAGYDAAVSFENLRSDKQGFYMRRALSDELSDNLAEAEKWTGYFLEGDAWRFEEKPEDYPLQTYVWEAMKVNDSTLELNPKILTEVRRFYRITQLRVRDMVSGSGASRPAAEDLRKDVKRMRADILPLLAKDMKVFERKLAARGIKVD